MRLPDAGDCQCHYEPRHQDVTDRPPQRFFQRSSSETSSLHIARMLHRGLSVTLKYRHRYPAVALMRTHMETQIAPAAQQPYAHEFRIQETHHQEFALVSQRCCKDMVYVGVGLFEGRRRHID